MVINLFDTAFSHLETPDGIYSTTPNRKPKNIKYVKNKNDWDGISLFTDKCLFLDTENIKSKYKIGWIIEPEEINPDPYQKFDKIMDNFDFILTYDETLLKKYPNKTKFYIGWATWILEKNHKIHKKTKNISMIFSDKKKTLGHKLRHEVAKNIKDIDLYGAGINKKIEFKDDILMPHRFSIEIENTKTNNCTSEKLMDCFVTGTIPIYWGCPNIGNFFDISGILTFDNIEELKLIINKIKNGSITYESMLNSINTNYNTFKKYDSIEDWIYEHIFKKL